MRLTTKSWLARALSVAAAVAALAAFCGALQAADTGPVKLLRAIYGEEAGDFNLPEALSCGERLTVADAGNKRLLFFEAAGEAFKPAGKFDANGKLGAPFCVAEVAGGKLLVAERGKPTLTLCDPKANTAVPAVLQGVPQGSKLVPGRFCVNDKGRIFVIDTAAPRIVALSPELRYEGEVSVTAKGFTGFSDVRYDRRGNLFALETLRGLVHVFDANLKPVRSFGSREGSGAAFEFPVSLATDRQGNVYVADSHRSQVLVLDAEGRLQWRLGGFGWKEGSFNEPGYVALDSANRIFVVDRLNNRVQVFAPLRPME